MSKKVRFFQVHSKSPPEAKATFATGHTQDIVSVLLPTFPFLPASVFVVTCATGTDEEVQVFSIKGAPLAKLRPGCGRNYRVAVNRDASLLAVAGWSAEAKMWGVNKTNTGEFTKLTKAMSLTGASVRGWACGAVVRLSRLRSAHRCISAACCIQRSVTDVSLSKDGFRTALSSDDGSWHVWDTGGACAMWANWSVGGDCVYRCDARCLHSAVDWVRREDPRKVCEGKIEVRAERNTGAHFCCRPSLGVGALMRLDALADPADAGLLQGKECRAIAMAQNGLVVCVGTETHIHFFDATNGQAIGSPIDLSTGV